MDPQLLGRLSMDKDDRQARKGNATINEAGDLNQTERERDRLKTFLEITFATIDQGITIYDAQLRLIAWNQKYVEMGIVPADGLTYGASLIDYYHQLAEIGTFGPGDPTALAERHIEALRSTSEHFIPSEILTPPSGRQIRIERFPLADGGICATFTDVSEEKRMREAMIDSQKLDELGKLISGNVHDVSNRAQVLQGYLELALGEGDLARKNRYLERAVAALEETRKVALSILRYGGHKDSRPLPCDMVSISRDWANVFKHLLRKGVELSVQAAEPIPELVLDQWQFQNCLLNMVNNAHDAISGKGSIVISIKRDGDHVEVCCIDDGGGVKQDLLDQIKQPQFTTKADRGGTGLGLYMVDKFCQQFGGTLTIESEVGQGTQVCMHLPTAQQEH